MPVGPSYIRRCRCRCFLLFTTPLSTAQGLKGIRLNRTQRNLTGLGMAYSATKGGRGSSADKRRLPQSFTIAEWQKLLQMPASKGTGCALRHMHCKVLQDILLRCHFQSFKGTSQLVLSLDKGRFLLRTLPTSQGVESKKQKISSSAAVSRISANNFKLVSFCLVSCQSLHCPGP